MARAESAGASAQSVAAITMALSKKNCIGRIGKAAGVVQCGVRDEVRDVIALFYGVRSGDDSRTGCVEGVMPAMRRCRCADSIVG